MLSESKGDCTPSIIRRSPDLLHNPSDSFATSISSDNRNSATSELTSNKRRHISSDQTKKLSSSPIIKFKPKLSNSKLMMQHASSCTALPELESSTSADKAIFEASTGELDLSVSPATFVRTLVITYTKSITHLKTGEAVINETANRVKHDSYFLNYLDEHIDAYTVDKVNAVQANDVATLRALFASGHHMQASNRFGESILHTSCRRGATDVVRFFLEEANVSSRVRDDMGRTPMHDACWLSGPPNHDIMKMLIGCAPEMLLSRDKRGHSPFDYARREYWPNWVAFLNEHRQYIVNSLVSSCLTMKGSDSLTDSVEGLRNDVAFRVVG